MTNKLHRYLNSIILAIVAVGLIANYVMHSHSANDCADVCFEKVTGMKAPKDIHE